ncbi:hypothetical protein ABT340_19465 [Streptosporangium sp. NPDC000239]|uniref:hypothetical protein n=1 Tax=Streptosporangium sp. NPDC000239 TaxID=3154248 RepID=UPI0033198050
MIAAGRALTAWNFLALFFAFPASAAASRNTVPKSLIPFHPALGEHSVGERHRRPRHACLTLVSAKSEGGT